jgi:phage-related protein
MASRRGEDPSLFQGGAPRSWVPLRRLQRGESLSMPQSRPMLSIGAGCHELRINDGGTQWRLVYRIDIDAIVILEVFAKKTGATPKAVIATCRERLKEYENAGK